ncbi:sensor histidine kinase [Paenibacillus sp. GCM10027626]|uniref:cache domain-containing sensor histidine kinase n=1 Tax=Paenibacillus sp. GCM10027626 TaxID=3273411 RepID=UPI003632EC71
MSSVIRQTFNLRHSLTGKFILILSIVLLATFSLTALITYQLHRDIAETEISEQFGQRVEQVAARIDLRLQDVYRVSDQIVLNSEVQRYFAKLNKGEVPGVGTQKDLSLVLNQLMYSVPNMLTMYLFDLGGGYFMPNGSSMPYEFGEKAREQATELLGASDGELVWLRAATLGYKINYFSREQGPVIVAARWMKDKNANKFGLLVLVMHESILANDLNNVISGNEGRVYLLDKRSSLLYTDENDPDKLEMPLLQSVAAPEIKQVNDTPYLFAQAATSLTGFKVISRVSMSTVRDKSKIIPQITLLSAFISVVIASALVALTTKRLLLPLRTLVRGMKRVEDGNLHARIEVRTKDELALIGQRFNSMLDHIDTLIKEGYEKQLREREAELTSLQAQLNPHFLYNTLDLLHSRMYMRDDRETAELVINLSELLRYALEPATTETVLRDELAQIGNYLSLQQARSADHLEIAVQADEGVLDCPIVRLLLQPLVENVFVHAFRDQAGLKRLLLAAYRSEDFLIIEIQDNGCGLPYERLRETTAGRQSLDQGKGRRRQSLGLRNVIRRIELMYGAPYRLEMESRPRAGTTMRLYLPYGKEKR